jgi:hypothetical protein
MGSIAARRRRHPPAASTGGRCPGVWRRDSCVGGRAVDACRAWRRSAAAKRWRHSRRRDISLDQPCGSRGCELRGFELCPAALQVEAQLAPDPCRAVRWCADVVLSLLECVQTSCILYTDPGHSMHAYLLIRGSCVGCLVRSRTRRHCCSRVDVLYGLRGAWCRQVRCAVGAHAGGAVHLPVRPTAFSPPPPHTHTLVRALSFPRARTAPQ